MSRYSIKVGETIAINGELFKIENIVGRKTQARAVETGELRDWPTSQLLGFYEKGQLTFTDLLSHEQNKAVEPSNGVVGRTLQDFPEPVQKKALRKWKYLKAICPEGSIRLSRTELQSTLNALAPEIDENARTRPPSVRTFYRWHRIWIKTQMDIRALVDRADLRGRKPAMNYPSRLASIITEGIETIYLTNQRETKQDLLKWIHHQTQLANRTLPPDEALPRVNMRTVNKFLAQYDRYHILKARYGERYARQSVQVFGKGPQVGRPLQRVEIDHTPCDILVVDERTKLVLGRPWVTVAIDYYSRMIVGMHIGFRGPCADSVLRCLRNAIAPKSYLNEKFPNIEGEWPCYGLMEEIWVDNGLEFHGKAVEAAAHELGIHVHYCPARQPHYKGVVERFNRTLNHGILHRLPGTTFSNYSKRLQYDADKQAVLSLSDLEEIVHEWVINVYGCEFHRGIQVAPLQKWTEGTALHPPKLPPDLNALKVYLAQTERRHLNKNGIQANGLRYVSDALQDMRHRYGNIEVTVRTDPDDLGTIFVLDEKRKTYVMAQCSVPGYADGLTTEQHRLISKKAKADYDQTPYAGRLLSAKSAIREKAAAILAKHQKDKAKPSGKPAKLNREAREILKRMPNVPEPAIGTDEPLNTESFLDDDWAIDAPDFVVDNRPFRQPSLNI